MTTELEQQAIDTAQACIDLNIRRLRLEEPEDTATGLFHILISLIEWCDAKGIDFDLSVEEVRRHFAETS